LSGKKKYWYFHGTSSNHQGPGLSTTWAVNMEVENLKSCGFNFILCLSHDTFVSMVTRLWVSKNWASLFITWQGQEISPKS